MPNDTERLDFLANLPTAEIIKKYSDKRGAHWPWTIYITGEGKGIEYDDFRDAVDNAMKRCPMWVPRENNKEKTSREDYLPNLPHEPTKEEVMFELERMIHQWDDGPESHRGYHRDSLWLEEVRQIIYNLQEESIQNIKELKKLRDQVGDLRNALYDLFKWEGEGTDTEEPNQLIRARKRALHALLDEAFDNNEAK